MFLSLSVAALILGFVSGAQDFDVIAESSHSHEEFEFVYHNMHDLLVVVHDNKCYYGKLIDNRGAEDRMMDSDHYRSVMEDYLMHVLPHGHAAEHSDLNTVRDEFQDRLADFRCDSKDIYTFELEARFVHLPLIPIAEICLRSRPSSTDDWSEWKTASYQDCVIHPLLPPIGK